MAGYSPLKITSPETGLVQNREEFLLPNDAYPVLQNAYVWRERIKRKRGYQLLGRLRRSQTNVIGNTDGAGNITGNLQVLFSLEPTFTIVPGSFAATAGGNSYTEPNPPNGTLLVNGFPAPAGSFIVYNTGAFAIVTGIPNTPVAVGFDYYPGLPVMGIRIRELQNSANDETIFFDQKYAYRFVGSAFQEFIPGTTWNASGGNTAATDFFWSTNYWVSQTKIPGTITPFFTTTNVKLFWETNNTGQFGPLADPPRITDGVTWYPFYDNTTPANTPWAKIDATTFLVNWLSMLPFRGRMVVFNTWEGINAGNAQHYSNRIRWSTIGNPFIPFAAGPPATGSWRDDIRGQGGFLDIPTSEDIVSIGFVRDNLVIYCERSTWQLRYTGRSIAPFQIERVNSELGGEGPFSAVQFDTSLVGIGDKGIVECDSYKSERIDIKIPDFVFQFQNAANGPFRVHGVRDFINRLAFWTIPLATDNSIFPTQRLVYNYENDSWALFNDSLTTLGTYQPTSGRTWLNTPIPWIECNFTWLDQPAGVPSIVGGNQQGFVEYLDELTNNDVSLFISNIVGHGIAGTPITGTPTVVTSPNHNMQTGFVIYIDSILIGTPYDTLNDQTFGIIVLDADSFQLMVYDPDTDEFSTPKLNVPSATYIGGGLIRILENFSITSKKFNFLDEGQNIQLGYIDILMSATEFPREGEISLNVYLDYDDENPSNTFPNNQINEGNFLGPPDTFFNAVIPTSASDREGVGGTKFWQRVFCATRASFLTLQYTFSNAQMASHQPFMNVQIDAQILWIRRAGRMTQMIGSFI